MEPEAQGLTPIRAALLAVLVTVVVVVGLLALWMSASSAPAPSRPLPRLGHHVPLPKGHMLLPQMSICPYCSDGYTKSVSYRGNWYDAPFGNASSSETLFLYFTYGNGSVDAISASCSTYAYNGYGVSPGTPTPATVRFTAGHERVSCDTKEYFGGGQTHDDYVSEDIYAYGGASGYYN